MRSRKSRTKHGRRVAVKAERRSRDKWFISYMTEVHQWNRRPGDKLTWPQRGHVIGGLAALLAFIALAVFLMGCMIVIAIEIGQQPDITR